MKATGRFISTTLPGGLLVVLPSYVIVLLLLTRELVAALEAREGHQGISE